MIKHTKPFLGIDYDLLAITSLVINGKTKEVKLHHKIIYSYLLSLSGTYQKVTPSLKGIGERLGVGTDQTVRRHIKDLVSFGWLKIEERAGSTNAYIVLPYEQEAQTQQEATVKAVPDQLPPTEWKMFKKWYSPSGNEYTATLPAVEIYSYIAGFNEQGQECYATQKTLANIGMVSDRQVRNIINMFVDMGVLSVETRHGQTSLYKALPFTEMNVKKQKRVKEIPYTENQQSNWCFYIQKLVSPFYTCLKAGITVDIDRRIKEQSKNSMFKHYLLDSFSGDYATIFALEKEVKKCFNRSLCLKEWLPDGYTETYNLEDYENIKNFVSEKLIKE
ncbi:hypothetical protein muut_154 [Escherichia phage muut]|uniref:Helix-turn-helix domain-containing protein n=4 Tax=root TaxID=1 RepID=A0A6B9WPC5_9CAUD|nr:hypothetical protein JR322_gp094 [Escherichia phage muut]QHR65951.1 hypothetical protein muut_154 [Escherichia phage muut]